jgi:adenosylcobalamin-dependent ribonucleoside-triphosphate reductase
MTTMIRQPTEGMGEAVARRTVYRQTDGIWETWGDVAHRVALGNSLLCPDEIDRSPEQELLERHIGKAVILLSGRSLQHGDKNQPIRNGEVFTNCSMSATTFLLFYLLLNGSGVGRIYDEDLCLVDWDNAPSIRCVLAESHPDFDYSAHESEREALHRYGNGPNVMWFRVPDSREGWAKAIELIENSAYEKIHKDKLLVLVFSDVREKGKPIGGMQNRPASGPVPMMNAIMKCMSLRGAGIEPWLQALYMDHYLAECVMVGGARRSARMAAKFWKDKGIFKFIEIKRPIEFHNKTVEEVLEMRKTKQYQSFLWSANNSVLVDKEFWRYINMDGPEGLTSDEVVWYSHAHAVFDRMLKCSYADGTGEPGLINQDELVAKNRGIEKYKDGNYVGSKKYQVNEDTQIYLSKLAKKVLKKRYTMGVNPCGEISILMLGAYCVIGDVVPYHADTLDEAEEAFRATTRALIRINLMDCLYGKEVKRTNRIGVGITGIHEFAWKFFNLGFRDLIDETKSAEFWKTISRFANAVAEEAKAYSQYLGVEIPHTSLTIKPAGTTSKLFGLTEGWHLPSMKAFLRYVQFNNGSPLINMYKNLGYPVKELVKSYNGTTVVGFPTKPELTKIMPASLIVTAAEATPEEQYKWVALGEKYWLNRGVENQTLEENVGNQISYTLKYNPFVTGFESFKEMYKKYQQTIKCCSVMPQEDTSSFEYLPETSISVEDYDQLEVVIASKKGTTLDLSGNIVQKKVVEDVDKVHVDCAGGACPVDFNK